ncbi:MAG: amino acid ABC transporter substrate-binding protein [Deltaproteobacteria bacterium]|nr:amino acid ABC transporter substrate-binding protein [Deltaproteobacteria bacterium]
MEKRYLRLLSLCVILGVFALFTNGVQSLAAEPIKIGLTISRSGRYADSGSYYKEAYLMWQDDVNAKGGLLGRPVKLIIYDDESSADKAVGLYERLINVDKVDLLLGPYTSTIIYPVGRIAEKYKMVLLQGGGTASKIFKAGFKYMFLTLPGFSEQHAIGFFEYLNTIPRDQWPKRAAVIYGDRSASIANARGEKDLARKNGISVVLDEKYPPDVTDLTSAITKAKNLNADLLMAGTYFPDAVLIARTIAELNYKPRYVLLTAGVSDYKFGEKLGALSNNIMGTAWWHDSVPFSREWTMRYKKRFGRLPDYHGAGAYAAAQILEAAVKATGSIDNTVLRDYIVSHSFDTVIAQGLSFDERGVPSYSMVTLQWQDGELKVMWPPEAQTAKPRPYAR